MPAVVAVLLAGACGTSTSTTPRAPRVLGARLERSTTSAVPAPVTVDGVTGAAGAADDRGGESTAPGTYHEAADNTPTLHYDPTRLTGVAESSTVVDRGRRRLRFDVELVSAGVDGVRVAVDLRNTSGRAMRFADGVRVVVHVRRNGSAWRDVTLTDATTALAPDATCSLQQVARGAEPGDYDATAETDVSLL